MLLNNETKNKQPPLLVVVMDGAECGKSTFAQEIANHFAITFLDADSFHSEDSIKQISQENPLIDEQSAPWIAQVYKQLSDFDLQNKSFVLACSGLKRQDNQIDALKEPVAYVRKNYMQNICLKELACITHLSISALERRFKKYLGKTPKQFINEVRLENARRLLIETNITVATIANDSGFTDHSYFSHQFQKFFKQSPSAFRQAHCANNI